MSELISGKDALIALSNGTKPGEIEGKFAAGASQFEYVNMEGKTDLFVKYLHDGIFRIKPRTVTINGVELAPCYAVGIDHIKNEASIQLNNNEDAVKLNNLLLSIYGFRNA